MSVADSCSQPFFENHLQYLTQHIIAVRIQVLAVAFQLLKEPRFELGLQPFLCELGLFRYVGFHDVPFSCRKARFHPADRPVTRRARGRERPPRSQASGTERVLARKPPKTGVFFPPTPRPHFPPRFQVFCSESPGFPTVLR